MHKSIDSKEKSGYLELITAMILSGMIGMFVEFSKQPIVNVVFYRCAIGSFCLLIYFSIKKLFTKQSLPKFRDCVLIVIVGISVVLNWVALFNSYSYASIGISTTIYHIQPVIVFFLGAIIFKEKIENYRVLWLISAFIGVLLIVNPFDQSFDESYLKGCALAFLAACLYATATLATKLIKNASPFLITLAQLLIGTFLLWPFVHFSILPKTSLELSSIIILGVVHSAFMYILLYSSYQKLSTSSIAILSYIYPIVAVLIDYLVFNKTLILSQIIGGIIVLAAGLSNKLSFNPFSLINKRVIHKEEQDGCS